MQNNSNDNGSQADKASDSIAPLGDDSVESLTQKPSAELNEAYGVKSADDKKILLDKESSSIDDIDDQDDQDNELDDDDDLADVRVANMTDDLDVIETDFGDIDYEDDDRLVEASSAKQLSSDQHLAAILRNNASLTIGIKASRRTIAFLLACIALSLAVIFVLFYAFTLYPKTVYIPTKDNAAICEVMPEDNPYLTDLTISEFGRDGILSLYSINFTNWQQQTDRVFDEYFTSDGKIRTIQALKESGLIAYVDNNALSLRANSTQTSHVESKGFFPNGMPYWTVSFPFVVEVYSGREKEPIQVRHYVATARVVVDRASATNPKGLGIDAVTLFESKK